MRKKALGLFVLTAALCGNVMSVSAAGLRDTFDAGYYAEHNPDVAAVYGNDADALYQHYVALGLAEGRQGCAAFHLAEYRSAYADLQAAYGDDWNAYANHYFTFGIKEGRFIGTYDVQAAFGIQDTNPAQGAPATEEIVPAEESYAEQVVRLVNEERARAGLSSVTLDANVASAAQIRAKEIEILFSHTRPDGSDCFTVLDNNGISYHTAGENIAWGQRSPQDVMNGWMNSPGHRANILDSDYKKIGVGYYQGASGPCWVQLFIG